jgi:prepilin-type N-terminal cleavage/methylation domain-containing protein
MKSNRGFTLIELLVVIAIIGILSSVVLASLNTARDKGSDAAVKANLANARAQAELYYDDQSPNTYASVCTASSGILSAVEAAEEQSGEANVACADSLTGWTLTAQISSDSYFCVDSEGAAASTTNAVGANPWVAGTHACSAL